LEFSLYNKMFMYLFHDCSQNPQRCSAESLLGNTAADLVLLSINKKLTFGAFTRPTLISNFNVSKQENNIEQYGVVSYSTARRPYVGMQLDPSYQGQNTY
jgi:hypothetical protein